MFSSEAWLAKTDSGFYNGQATQSARFYSGSSSYLSFTPSGNGDRRKATLSFWFKKTTNGETYPTMFCCNDSSSGHYMTITFYEDSLYFQTAPSADGLITTAKYMDTTAWYHCCWSIDTTQSTASDRVKCYINGSQITSFSTEQYPDQDSYLDICSTVAHAWGYFPDYGRYFNGYIADAYIIDGQQLTPSSFTEVKFGALIPKAYEGSYGTNGVHLEFKQTGTGTASTSTIGADTSGNTHHYTSAGMDSHDSNLPDCPENNFCTLNNLLYMGTGSNKISGNLEFEGGGSGGAPYNYSIHSNWVKATGKWYWEVHIIAVGNASVGVFNVTDTSFTGTSLLTQAGVVLYYYDGRLTNQATYESFGNSYTTGDVIGVALDCDNDKIYFSKNGTFQNSQNPTDGTNAISIESGKEWGIGYVESGSSSSHSDFCMNFGQEGSFNGRETPGGNADANGYGNFFSSVPSGYLAPCSANLPEPTISPNADNQSSDFFQVYTFTGDANSTRTISGLNFQPDLLWSKARNQAFSHNLYDSSRGNDKAIQSNNSNAENTYDLFNGFTSDGYNTTTDGSVGDLLNYNGGTYVNWLWKANGGTTTTNDASATGVGTIDSVYQSNTTAGFSIVTWTGTGSAGSIASGLGGVPEVMIIKNRSEAHSWSGTYHHKMASDPETDYLNLSGTGGVVDDNTQWNDTAPTSTVFTVGTANNTNKSGNNYVGYFFRGIEGYSKFGSYASNNSSDGVFVHLGFQPAWLMIKLASASGEDWHIFDNKRATDNVVKARLIANGSATENTNDSIIDFLSNGFKLRDNNDGYNGSSKTYVYMAFAEMPSKYSLAR